MAPSARLQAISTAVPPERLAQSAVKSHIHKLFREQGYDVTPLLPAFDNAGIEVRYSAMPMEWYAQPRNWPERTAIYQDAALAMLEDAAIRCLRSADLEPADIDCLLLVSSTGIATPSLESLLMDRLAFREDVERLPVFGLGCAGGVIGLGQAARLAEARPGSRVLLLVVELCSLNFRAQDLSKSNVIASALFGDGAAAVLVSTDARKQGPVLGASAQHRWPGSKGIMGWRVEEDGLGVIFSRDIPHLVRRELGPLVKRFLKHQNMTVASLAHSACHPGGAKVIAALEEVLQRPLPHERQVLRAYGNMSAPTALFVLERVLSEERRLEGPLLSTALGPGFSAALQLVLPGGAE